MSDQPRILEEELSLETRAHIREFHATQASAWIPLIVQGIFARFVQGDALHRLRERKAESDILEDLEFDSLLTIEAVIYLEEVFNLHFDQTEIVAWRSVGDVQEAVRERLPSRTVSLRSAM